MHDYEEEGDALFSRCKDFIGDILAGKMEHNNARKALAEGYEYRGQPAIISECGGIAFFGGAEGGATATRFQARRALYGALTRSLQP